MSAVALRTPLVERSDDLATLRGVADAATGGGARFALVSGPAGSGKTRIVEELIATLLQDTPPWDVVVVLGSAASRSTGETFAEVRAGGPRGAGLAGAPLGPGLAADLRARGGGPIALVIDDLQLLDPAAVTALDVALDEMSDHPLLVVSTFRTGALALGSLHARAVSSLLARHDSVELVMHSLSREGVAALAAAIEEERGAPLVPVDLDAVLRRTDGNPFLVDAVLRSGSGPDAIDGAIAAMLDGAGAAERDLALVLAVADSPLPAAVLRREDPDGTASRALLDRGIARVAAGALELAHDLIGDALRRTLDPLDEADRHRRLAVAYTAAGPEHDAAIAWHWAGSGDVSRAAPHALRAADRLVSVGRHSSALPLYELASRGRGDGMPTGATILERAATAAVQAGETTRAELLIARARRAALVESGVEVDTAAPGGGSAADDTRWGNPLFARLARADAHAAPDTEVDAALATARRLLTDGDYAGAIVVGRAAHDAARRAERWAEVAEAGLVVFYAGDPAVAMPMLLEAEAGGRAADEVGVVTMSLTRQSRVQSASGDLDAALAASRTAYDLARRAGSAVLWGNLGAGLSSLLAQRGEFDEARRLATQIRTVGDPIVDIFADADDWIIAVFSGDAAGARTGCDRVLPVARAYGDPYFLVPMLAMTAKTFALEGDHHGALAAADEALGLTWSPLHEQAVDLHLTSALAGLAIDDPAPIDRAVHALADLRRSLTGPGIRGAAEFAQGVQSVHAGDTSRARTALARASHRLRSVGRRPLAAAAEHLLADLGGEPPGRLDALDDRQRQIAEGVAAGASNREIAAQLHLSEKTVRNALSVVYRELGVRRRSELVALMSETTAAPAAGGPPVDGADRGRPADGGRARRASADGGAPRAPAPSPTATAPPRDPARLTVLASLQALTPAARTLAEALALLPAPVPAPIAERAGPPEAIGDLIGAGRAWLADGEPLVHLDPELAQVVGAGWDPVTRAARQRALAERLTADGGDDGHDDLTSAVVATAAAVLWADAGDHEAAACWRVDAGDWWWRAGSVDDAVDAYLAALALDRSEAIVERAALAAAHLSALDPEAERTIRAAVLAVDAPPGWSVLGRDARLRHALAGVIESEAGDGAPGIVAGWAGTVAAAVAAVERGDPDGSALVEAVERVADLLADPAIATPVALFEARRCARAADVAGLAAACGRVADAAALDPMWLVELSAVRRLAAGPDAAPEPTVLPPEADGDAPPAALSPDLAAAVAAWSRLVDASTTASDELLALAADTSAAFVTAGAPRRGVDAWALVAQRCPAADVRAVAADQAAALAATHDLLGVEDQLDRACRTEGSGEPRPEVPGLTRRESDVAHAAAAGRTNPEIAAELGLTTSTVRNYLTSVFAKLAVERRSQLGPAIAAALADRPRGISR